MHTYDTTSKAGTQFFSDVNNNGRPCLSSSWLLNKYDHDVKAFMLTGAQRHILLAPRVRGKTIIACPVCQLDHGIRLSSALLH